MLPDVHVLPASLRQINYSFGGLPSDLSSCFFVPRFLTLYKPGKLLWWMMYKPLKIFNVFPNMMEINPTETNETN